MALCLGILLLGSRYTQQNIAARSQKKELTTPLDLDNNQNPTWDQLNLEEKASILQPLLAKKETLTEAERKDLSKKLHQFLILLLADRAEKVIRNIAQIAAPDQAEKIAKSSNLIIIFDQILTKLLQPEYIQALKRVGKTAQCIRTNNFKNCKEICSSKQECISSFLLDTASILEPFIKAGIGTTKIGTKEIHGILPLIFSLAAPENQATQELLALSIMLDSSIGLLQTAGRETQKATSYQEGDQ